MRKQVFGRRFKRDRNERKALFSGLISAMVMHGRIKTTEEKAKAIKSDLEKLVTKAKKEEDVARKHLQSLLKKHEIEKMINEIAPGFKNRAGGYTRIIKTGNRFSDNASMAILEWSEMEKVEIKKPAASNAASATTKKQKKVPSKSSRATGSRSRKETSSPRKATKGKK